MAIIELNPGLFDLELTQEFSLNQESEKINQQTLALGAVPLYGEARLDNGQHWNRLQKLAEFTCMRLDIREAWHAGNVIDKVAVIPKIAELAISGQLKGVFN